MSVTVPLENPNHQNVVKLREGNGSPAYFRDGTGSLTFLPILPVDEPSWIVKSLPAGTYIRYFKAGGRQEFDSAGKLTLEVDASGNNTTLTYTSGRLTGISNASGRSLTLGYGANGHGKLTP